MCIMAEPGKLLDGKMLYHPRLLNYGVECLDLFNALLNNVTFNPQYDAHGKLLPYMLGTTTRQVKKGEQLAYSYGKEHWLNKAHFDSLSAASKQDCMKFYNFTGKEVVKQVAKPTEPLSPPTGSSTLGSPGRSKRISNKK